MKRVLLVTNDFPPMPGGCARYYERLCQQAPEGSLEVLAPRWAGWEERDRGLPVRVHRCRAPTSPHPVARLVQCVVLAWHAGRLLRRGAYCAVHLGHLYLVPVGVLLHKLFGVAYAVYLHGGESPNLWRWWAGRTLFRRWLRGAAAVAVNSDFTHRHFLQLGFQLPYTVCVRPTVDPRRYQAPPGARERLRGLLGLEGSFVVLSVGRLVARKAHDLLLHALARLTREGQPVAAAVVGDGPERPRLEALAGELGITDRVRFVGWVPEEVLPDYYAAADAFVLASRALAGRDGVEGFGIVFLEAGAAGLPVVGASTGGIPEAVEEGRTGLLVPPDDVEALADALRWLVRDPDKARRLGEEGRRRAAEDAREAVLDLWRASGWRAPDGLGGTGGMRELGSCPTGPDQRPRVLHVITRLVVGGAQENTLLTVRGLQARGYHVELAAGPQTGPEGSLAVPEGIPFHLVPTLVREVRPLADLRALWDLYRLMRRGYDLVHTHTSKAGVLGRIAARLARVPVMVHTPHGHVYHGYGGRLRSYLFACAERMLARWTHALVALTDSERQEHLRERVGRPEQWRVIPSGIEVERYRVPSPLRRTDLGLPEEAFLVGCVARLVEVKGVDDAIEATARMVRLDQRVRLVLVGDGPLRARLEEQAARCGIGDRVHFLGVRRDVPHLLPLFDVLVLPSRNEGMGRVLLEAAAAGVPVVATRVGGAQDVVREGETGLLVPASDPPALAAAVACLAADAERRRQMACAARAWVGEKWSAESMVRDLEAAYREAGKRVPPGKSRVRRQT